MSTDAGSGGVVVGNTTVVGGQTASETEVVEGPDSYVVFPDGGVQGPPGAAVEMRRQGTSGVIEWKHEDEDVWKELIDLADGVVAVKPVPPKFIVDATSVTEDITKAAVAVTQPDELEGTYHLSFTLPRGPQGIQGIQGKQGEPGQPKFSGDGPPGDDSLYPGAVEGDLYWDRLDGRIYTFHPDGDPTTPGATPGAGTGTTTPTTGTADGTTGA